ncbi:hypothetical protein FJD06_25955, partial [Escherichia coli]|nr:hypothetical protein [Escherichia coli]
THPFLPHPPPPPIPPRLHVLLASFVPFFTFPSPYIAPRLFRLCLQTPLLTRLAQRCKFCRRFQAAKSITKRELSKNAQRK